MLSNYLRVALRAVQRHKAFAFINISGLGLGMAACLLIVLFVRDELSYDQWHTDKDRLYRVTYHATNNNDYARIPPPIGPHMADFFTEVETAARVFTGNMSVQVPSAIPGQPDQTFEETNLFFVDSTFTDLFPLTAIQGPANPRVEQPFTVLLNEEVAERYFGNDNAVGKTLRINGNYTFTVAGVVQDMPRNTHFHFNLLLPYDDMFKVVEEQTGAGMRQNFAQNWVMSHSITYVRLHEGASPDGVNARFPDLVATHAPEQLQVGQTFSLMPVTDIHLRSNTFLEVEPQGDIRYVYIFSGIAVLTLLLPCFNFINLATAQSMSRSLEVGVRKALGAHQGQLFRQFMSESAFIAGLAFVLALGLTLIGLPYLNDLTGKELTAVALLDPVIILGFVSVFAVTALLGGTYPAWLIARTNVVRALRGAASTRAGRRFSLRQGLVAAQFAISLALVAGSLVVFKQLNYMMDRPLGYQPDGVIAAPLFSQNMNSLFVGMDGELRQRLNAFEDRISQEPGVLGSTLSRNALGLGSLGRGTLPEGQDSETPMFIPAMAVDYDFLDLYGLDIVAGRSFEQERGTDHTNAFIVNEAAVRSFGWNTPQEALGKSINLEGKQGQVIGVVRDFNYQSLQNAIEPALMEVNVPAFRTISIRVAGNGVGNTIATIERLWEEFFPGRAFDYIFVDAQLATQYQTEERLGDTVQAFSILAIIVSCLGAYGLVLFNVRRRQREIGVRKVLGASLPNLLRLLYGELTALFVVGLVIAVPLVYYLGTQWLADFSYRTTIGVDVFLWSGLLMIALAWITISFQSIKAARLNPVDCLRDD